MGKLQRVTVVPWDTTVEVAVRNLECVYHRPGTYPALGGETMLTMTRHRAAETMNAAPCDKCYPNPYPTR